MTLRLLRRVSSLVAVWVAAAGGFIVLFGWWLIPLLYGAEYAPAYPAAVLLLAGYGAANIFSWNRPLLLALGKPTFPLVVAAAVGAVELVLIFQAGYPSMAISLRRPFCPVICLFRWASMSGEGLVEIRHQSAMSKPV